MEALWFNSRALATVTIKQKKREEPLIIKDYACTLHCRDKETKNKDIEIGEKRQE